MAPLTRVRHRTALALAAATAAALTATAPAGPAAATYRGDPGRLFFGAFSTGPFQADLYSVEPDGTGLQQLTATPGLLEICPASSPDGQHIAYCSGANGVYEMWRMRADGTHPQQLTGLGRFSTFPDWSPDGTRLAFNTGPDATWQRVALLDLATRHVTALTTPGPRERDWLPAWRPQGERIVFVRDVMSADPPGAAVPVSSQLWTRDLRTGRERQLTDDATIKGQLPDWSPNGSRIAYGADGDVWVVDAGGGRPRNLTRTPDAEEFGAAWSPDGSQIAFVGTGGPVPPGERYVQVMDADGSDRRVLLPTPGLRQAVPGWQPLARR